MPSVQRDLSLDFVKGLLVIAMIAYHAGGQFIADTSLRTFICGSVLGFVSGSWIFISGIIISISYNERFSEQRWEVSRRLVTRGVKLIVLFAVINLIIRTTGIGFSVLEPFGFQELFYVAIHGDGSLVSLEIILGIGYLLIVSPLYLWWPTVGSILICVMLIGGAIAGSMNIALATNFWMLCCGLAGILVGRMVKSDLFHRLSLTESRKGLGMALAGVSIVFYYGLNGLVHTNRADILVYILGILSILAFFYLAHRRFSAPTFVEQLMWLLARYSLVAYILQMGVILLLQRAFPNTGYLVAVLIVLAATSSLLFALGWLRARSAFVRQAYSLVFN